MAAKEKESESSLNFRNIFNFFEKLLNSAKSTSPAEKVSSDNETCNESVKPELAVQKKVRPTANDESRTKGSDESKTSSKDFQNKDYRDLGRLLEREVDTRERVIETVKTEEERKWKRNLIQDRSKSVERPGNEQHFVQSKSSRRCQLKTGDERQSAINSIQNRSRQDRSKSVERPRNEQHSAQSYLPKPCKFKTEDGHWLCEVCSWSSSNSTLESFLDHCSSRNHREKMKGRFNTEQELGGLYPFNLSEVKNKTDESKADSQFMIWPQIKKDGEILGKTKTQRANLEQEKEKSKMCNSKNRTKEMICESQQTRNRVCQESSKKDGLTSRMKDFLKEGLPVEEPFKTLTLTHSVRESKTQNDKSVNKVKPEADSFKGKLFEALGQKEKAEKRKRQRKKKKTDENTNLDGNKVKTDSKINTSKPKNLCKGGGEGSGQSEDVQIAEMKKLISALGITFIEPLSVNFLNCKVCDKLVPAGSNLETLLINVGIHVEGKPHIKKLELILESSNAMVNLMKAIGKSPTGSLPKLTEKF